MLLVTDASAVVPPLLGGPAGIGLLARHDLIAPSLLWSEASSVLHELAWRGQVSGEEASRALGALLDLDVEERRGDRLRSAAWDVAERMGWAKTYDAEYVALAELEGVPLLTLDSRLHRGAARLVETVQPTDLQ